MSIAQHATHSRICAPVTGIYGALENVPDAAMASGALGPGLYVEPLSSQICAPCSGSVISIASTLHAVTLRSECGAEILIHVGVDTVKLKGRGFDVHVEEGQSVNAGDVLVAFESATLMEEATSLATPIILLSTESHELAPDLALGHRQQRDTIATIIPKADKRDQIDQNNTLLSDAGSRATQSLQIELIEGIHARPAAQIAKLAKQHVGIVEASCGARTANAKSIAGLMSLGVAHGSLMTLSAKGDDAERVVDALIQLIKVGAGDKTRPIIPADSNVNETRIDATPPAKGDSLTGVRASAGLAVGPIVLHEGKTVEVPEHDDSVEQSLAIYSTGRERVRAELLEEARTASKNIAGILEAHAELLEDPDLIETTEAGIAAGASAGAAFKRSILQQVDLFSSSDDPRLNERTADLRDVEQRLLVAMYGSGDTDSNELPEGAIVVAHDLMPSEFLAYVEKGMSGLCLAAGGQTSHVAILATGENIPTLVAMGPRALEIPANMTGILDLSKASLLLAPDETDIAATRDKIDQRKRAISVARQAQFDRARTEDGTDIAVYANLGSLEDASKAMLNGAEGSGLLRTEFLFTDRSTAPSEDEQYETYVAILSCLKQKPLTIRTLDIGGDKPVPFLDHGEELNPALGMRGIRTFQNNPQLLRDQVRALLRASQHGAIDIMVPMISSASELQTFRDYVMSEAEDLGVTKTPSVGTMIETPASAIIADQIAEAADFLSIGTNDLAQYTLAMDRGHPSLANQLDGLHPAILRLINDVTKTGRTSNVPVSVCGGLASDPFAVPLLLGFGIQKLSCSQSMIAPVKALIRELKMSECQDIANASLTQSSGDDVRALVSGVWPSLQQWI